MLRLHIRMHRCIIGGAPLSVTLGVSTVAMEPLLYFGAMVLVSIPFTALICRFRLAHKRRVYWGTVLAGALGASLTVFLATMVYSGDVGDLLRPASWFPEAKSPGALFIITVPAFLCVLPAVAVVAYYQRRHAK